MNNPVMVVLVAATLTAVWMTCMVGIMFMVVHM